MILAGGVLRNVSPLSAGVRERLLAAVPSADVRLLDVEPACGAVHLALASLRGKLRLPRYAQDS